MRRFYFTHFTSIPTNNDTTTTNQNPPANETFTKEQVNELLLKETDKVKKERDATVAQLEQLKKSQGLTAKEKEALTKQIDDLKSLNLSKEEQAKIEAARLEKTFGEEKENILSERNHWKNQYEAYRIDNEIYKAADKAKAFSADQLVDFLKPKTKLIERKEVVNGKEEIVYTTLVKFADRDKDGKPVMLDLSVEDAIKRMRELPTVYGNLFKSETKGGTGLLNSEQVGDTGGSGFSPNMGMEKYLELRKAKGFGSQVR